MQSNISDSGKGSTQFHSYKINRPFTSQFAHKATTNLSHKASSLENPASLKNRESGQFPIAVSCLLIVDTVASTYIMVIIEVGVK